MEAADACRRSTAPTRRGDRDRCGPHTTTRPTQNFQLNFQPKVQPKGKEVMDAEAADDACRRSKLQRPRSKLQPYKLFPDLPDRRRCRSHSSLAQFLHDLLHGSASSASSSSSADIKMARQQAEATMRELGNNRQQRGQLILAAYRYGRTGYGTWSGAGETADGPCWFTSALSSYRTYNLQENETLALHEVEPRNRSAYCSPMCLS